MKYSLPVSLIIIELSLPGLDGFGFLTMVKSDPALKDIPVLVLTSRDSREEKERAVELGALDCLVKYRLPPAELKNMVKVIVGE
ncbi:MAG: response regulator [Candidatus Omnitrophica bacterium]|nr:response regulator [Candidatus Omnitrophota bacterium]